MTLTYLKCQELFQMDVSLISEESACENSRGMKEMGVFGKLFYTMAQCDFNLEYMQGVFKD